MEEFKNIISTSIRKELTNFFWESKDKHYQTRTMLKIREPWNEITKELLEPILSNIMNTRNNLGDNYFYHKYSYLPHCECGYDNKESYNVLIPLELENAKDDQYFIIFDQLFLHIGNTFCGDLEISDFDHNKLYRGRIKDEDADNLTHKNIDLQFYKTYLESKSRSRELFWGLSGNVFNWEPGNVIIFDSRHIHCSGKMNCDAKLGLSLRFEQ